jgi:alanine racemase
MGPTIAYISHKNLLYNIDLIRRAIGSRKIMAVVKAFAYGHGDIEVAKTALKAGCEYLGVAFVEEGIRLRKAGITAPVLVFGAQLPDYLQSAIEYNLDLTITSRNQLLFLETVTKEKSLNVPIHLKFDTGMNRVGFPINELEDVIKNVKNNKRLDIKGIYSHLSTSDENDKSYTNLQIQRFDEIQKYVNNVMPEDIIFHLANSAAIMRFSDSYFDLVRPGIMLYGQSPSPDFTLNWDLKEVLSLRSRIGLIKRIKKNEPVSYGRRFYTKETTHIGVIPAGYADGINRGLTNNARVIIRDIIYPIIGTVCMDMVMVDLGADLKCNTGDEVIFYGQANSKSISINEIAKNLKTIAYEVTCNVSARVPRKHLYS